METFKIAVRQKSLYFLFYTALALGTMAPIAVDHYIPALADYVNHLSAIIQAKMAFAEGQFPLRIAPLEQEGLRYPYFQFYSPTTYTFAAGLYQWLTPHNPLMALKIAVWCGLVLGAAYMGRLSYWFMKSRPNALLTSVAYLLSPYYIVVINNFCDLSEILALGLLPAALYYSFKRYERPSHANLLQVGLLWYLLITVHSVTFLYSVVAMGLILLALTLQKRQSWKNLIQVGIGVGFAAILAIWYLAPVQLWGHSVLISQTFEKSAAFNQYSPAISQLLSPGAAPFKKELIYNHPAVGWAFLLAVGVCTYAVFHPSQFSNKKAHAWMPTLLASFYILFLLIWAPINIWQWLPEVLRIGQYSWRLLGQINWIGALLFSWGLGHLFQEGLDIRHTVIGIGFLAMLSNQWFPSVNNANIDIKKFTKHPYFIYNQNAYSINFNKNTQFVDSIDTIFLYSIMAHNRLQMEVPYFAPRTLLSLGATPTVVARGNMQEKSTYPEVRATVNGHLFAKKDFQPGPFEWKIPLAPALEQFKTEQMFALKFSSQGPLQVPVSEVALTGFLSPKTTVPLQETKSHCTQHKTKTICHLAVSETSRLIELPVLYYPQLLKITVDGKKVPYQSIVYYDYLITGITPDRPGMKTIEIEFTGLNWANWASRLGWGLWSFLLVATVFRRKRYLSSYPNP